MFNVVVCAIIVTGATAAGFAGSPFAFVVAALAAAGEVQFVRVMIGAFRQPTAE